MKKNSIHLSLYLLTALACAPAPLLCGDPQSAQGPVGLPQELLYLASLQEAKPVNDWTLIGDIAYLKVSISKQFFPVSELQTLLQQTTANMVVMQISTQNLKGKFVRVATSYRYLDDAIPATALTASHKPQE